jgi:hypothetical protein
MTTETASPAPAAPKAPEPSVVERANQSIAAAKTGYDPLRPLRYAFAFTGGTVRDTLNGVAKWGREGLKYGLIGGAVLGIFAAPVGFGFSVAVLTMGTMFAAGALGGGLNGLLLGGKRAVGRIQRAELYAEDLIKRSDIQRDAPPPRTDYRAQHRARLARQREENAGLLLQTLERENERARDAKIYGGGNGSTSASYWQDREQERDQMRASAQNQGVGF